MRFHLTRSDCPLMKLTARAGNWSCKRYLGPFTKEYELTLPEGINPDELEVTTEACDQSGKPLEQPVILKAAKETAKAAPIIRPATIENPKPKPERRRRKRRGEQTAQEERPSDQPLSADCVVTDDRDAG
jgi:hypothetical protein